MSRVLVHLRARVDQRFFDPVEEGAFVQSGEPARLAFATVFALISTIVLSWYDIVYIWKESHAEDDPLPLHVWDMRWMAPSMTVVCFVLGVTVLVVSECKRRWDSFRHIPGELLVMVMSSALFLRMSLGRRYNLRMLAEDHEAAWVLRIDQDDTNSLLCMDTIVTALALSASLRIHRLIMAVSVAFVPWVVVTHICGSSLRHSQTFVPIVLLMLILFACAGAARAETFIRREWRQQRRLIDQEQQLNVQSALASSLQSIAERLCDLVVLLDSELAVMSNEVPVNTFFGRSMFGRRLADLIASSDRESFEETLRRACEAEVPQCVPVTLVVSDDRRQNAHLLVASTGAISPKYLVGVSVDAGDSAHAPTAAVLRHDVANVIETAPDFGGTAGSECQTSFSGRVFSSLDLEQLAALGRIEHWWIDPEDLSMPVPICILGEGGVGIVATACYRGRTVAVKISKTDEGDLPSALAELRVLRRFRHPNVVLLYGAVVSPGRMGIVLVYERLCGMLLDDLLETRRDLTAFDRYQVLHAINSALVCLHLFSPSIVHGDLKPQNIMVEETSSGFRPKLLDFGLARLQGRGAAVSGGTLAWRAPETMLPHASVGTASDVYSFGWLALRILAGAQPYDGLAGPPLRAAVQRMLSGGKSPVVVVPESAPFRRECQALCGACLRFDPGKRASMQKIQVDLAGWVPEEQFCELGVVAVTRSLRQVSWQRGKSAVHESTGAGVFAVPEGRVHIDIAGGFKVLGVQSMNDAAGVLPLPNVGEAFCDWLEDSVGFRILSRATLSDLRSGAKAAPLTQRLLLLRWRPPGRGDEHARRISMWMVFPGTSGLVKLRLRLSPEVPLQPEDLVLGKPKAIVSKTTL